MALKQLAILGVLTYWGVAAFDQTQQDLETLEDIAKTARQSRHPVSLTTIREEIKREEVSYLLKNNRLRKYLGIEELGTTDTTIDDVNDFCSVITGGATALVSLRNNSLPKALGYGLVMSGATKAVISAAQYIAIKLYILKQTYTFGLSTKITRD